MTENILSAPVTVSFREDERDPGHVRVSVFIGRNPSARGRSGQLVIRTDEWDEARPWLETFAESRHVLETSDSGWHLEHAPQCRAALADCPVHAAIAGIGAELEDWPRTWYFVWLDDWAGLVTEPIA